MAKKYQQIEENVAEQINALKGQLLPAVLPDWMIKEGIHPAAEIVAARDIGSKSSDNKTDVYVELKDSAPIKISVKMTSADYWGNWYGHDKFVHEFGRNAFEKLSKATTDWANEIMVGNDWENKPFVGVSISFGKRSGQTKLDFDDILTKKDMLKVIRGEKNSETPEAEANSLLIANDVLINTPQNLIDALEELSVNNVYTHMSKFYIIFRPINPQTEGSNRGKNTYTRFVPFKKLDHMVTVTKMSELRKYGKFETVEPQLKKPKLTHNFVLNNLEENYNIKIPRKGEK